MDKLELVTRNVEEVVTMDKLKQLWKRTRIQGSTSATSRAGTSTSANDHFKQAHRLPECRIKSYSFTGGLHAYLNRKGTMEEIEKIARYNKRCFIALGLSEENTRFVLGPSYQLTSDYEMNVFVLHAIPRLIGPSVAWMRFRGTRKTRMFRKW